MRMWVPAAVGFIVAGVLEVLFLCLSLLGTLMGGAMTVGSVTGALQGEDAVVGPIIFLFYGVWLVATGIAGPLHLFAGGSILAGSRNKKVLWAATAVSLLPMATIYCAPTSIIAGVLGLVAAVTPDPDVPSPT